MFLYILTTTLLSATTAAGLLKAVQVQTIQKMIALFFIIIRFVFHGKSKSALYALIL
jgi:hypothetical protein